MPRSHKEEKQILLLNQLTEVGITDEVAKKAISSFSEEQVEKAVQLMAEYEKQKKITNKNAFFLSALRNEWGETSEDDGIKKSEIAFADSRFELFRKSLKEELGEDCYGWIDAISLKEIQSDKVVIEGVQHPIFVKDLKKRLKEQVLLTLQRHYENINSFDAVI